MIKKFFLILLGLIVVILIAVFVLLFTSFGNGILKPYIQTQIDKYSPIPLTLDVFSLRFGSFDVVLNSTDKINITSNGTFSLISQDIDASLNILLKNPLSASSKNSPREFLIENAITGKIMNFDIHTLSNSLDGEFRIDTNITNFKPLKIIASIKNIQIESILALLDKKPYAVGKIDITADIIGDENMKFNGQALMKISNGEVSQKYVKEDFGITLPNNSFMINLLGNFDGANIKHNLEMLSNVGNINSIGSTVIETLNTNSTYDVNLSDLSLLTPIIGMPVRGEFKTNGKITGNSKWINIDGASDVADSNTTYSVSLENYSNPKDILLKVRNLKIEKVLHMLFYPSYANGLLNIDADLNDIVTGINGDYTHTISGNIIGATIKNEFDINMLNTDYAHKANIKFTNGIGNMNADLNMPFAALNIKDTLINTESLGIKALYTLDIKDLKKIAFITGKELKGNLVANGDVAWTPTSLRGTMKSNLLGGSLDAEINNNLLNAMIKNINSSNLLDMLQYPKIFNSDINGTLKYDTQTQRGNVEFILSNGSFAENKLMNILQSTLKFDAMKEVYNNIKLDATINKSLVTANLNMVSNNTSITSNGATLNLDNDDINANLALKVQTYELNGIVSGKATNPNIKIDTSKLGKTIINNVMKNEKVQESVKKVEDKAKNLIKDGLNNLFKK